ncbi:MAG: response regulator [Planctomycetota bacterium]|jgi:two-component system phosphate regulon response regulator PhoB
MMSQQHTILVIDDEPHITHVVALKLSNAGYDVLTAGDGEEGLDIARERTPDLIITDLQMPYLTGVELCHKLQEHHTTASIPVLVLTARGYSLAPEDIEGTTIRGMISKPFSPREILEQVQEALNESDNDARNEAA